MFGKLIFIWTYNLCIMCVVVSYDRKPIKRIHVVGEIRSVKWLRGRVNKSNEWCSKYHYNIGVYRGIGIWYIYNTESITFSCTLQLYSSSRVFRVYWISAHACVCVMCINVFGKIKLWAITFLAKRSPYVRKADTSVGLTRSSCL